MCACAKGNVAYLPMRIDTIYYYKYKSIGVKRLNMRRFSLAASSRQASQLETRRLYIILYASNRLHGRGRAQSM